MKSNQYELTFKDCKEYYISCTKIPRLNKIIFNRMKILFICYSIFLLCFTFYGFFKTSYKIMKQYSLSFLELVSNSVFPNVLIFVIKNYILPIGLAFLVVYVIFLLSDKYDIFNLNTKQIYNMMKNTGKTMTVSILPEGIKLNKKSNTMLFNWEIINDCYKTKKLIIIFVGEKPQGIIIPLRAFDNEVESETFFKAVNDKIKSL